MNGSVNTIYREPFALGSPELMRFEPGVNVGAICERMACLPDDFFDTGRVFLDQIEIPRALWFSVKPKAGVTLTFHGFIQGGGDEGGGKAIFGVIAALALTVFTAGIAGGLLAPLLGSGFAAGTLGASALAAGVGLVGQLAISALTAPPSNEAAGAGTSDGGATLEASSVKGNVLAANSPVPRVIGTRRIFPPFAFEPVIEMVGQDQIVEAAYCLAGPHHLTDIQLGERTVDTGTTDTDLTIETREGLPGDASLSLTQRQGRTSDLNLQMSLQGADEENPLNWDGETLAKWHGFNGRLNPDAIWIHFQLNGLQSADASTTLLRIPLRLRMRRRGDTAWRNLPELHYQDATQSQVRFQVQIHFGDAHSGGLPQPNADRGFVEARKLSPGQTVAPTGADWEADSYFSDGAGDDVYRQGTQNSTNLLNCVLGSSNKVDIYLDEAEWPVGIYDVEVIRGAVFTLTSYASDAYTINGNVLDLFGTQTSRALPMTRKQMLDGLHLIRAVSIWNNYPINQAGLSLISLKATNRQVSQLSVLASGYVRDYGGYSVPVASPVTTSPLGSLSGGGGGIDGSLDVACQASMVLPVEPTESAVIWERGASGGGQDGASLYYSDGYLILRGGSDTGDVATGTDVVVIKIAITSLPFDGEVHKIAWDFKVSPGRARLWIDDVLICEESTTGGGDLGSSAWTGTSGGGYLTYTGDVAGVTSPVDWDDTGATDLSMWEGALHDATGQGWDVFAKTSNPAPHFRDVSSGTLNFDPLPESVLDDASILAWRDACFRSDYTCDLIAEGTRVQELRNLIASCGFARPYQSELWGVIRDYDRSAESPVQIFSPRNSKELNWKKAFPRLPTGFRVNYKNGEAEDADTQIIVYRRGSEGNATRLEQVTYQGITREAKAIERADFDLKQGRMRSMIYSMQAPIESIVCRRGSLIGVNHDILLTQYGSARVVSVTVTGSGFEAINIDTLIDVKNNDDMLDVADMLEVADMHEVGLKTSIAIRRTDGTFSIHPISNAAGESDVLTFTTPFPYETTPGGPFDAATISVIDEGCLIVVGTAGKEYKRLIVTEIVAQNDHAASLTMVDEAPEIWS